MSYVVNFFSFQGLIVSYLYKDFGGARKTNAVPCIVYFLNLLRGKCRAKVGVAFYNYYSFRKVSVLLMRFRQLLFFNIAVNKILSYCFLSIFFHFIFQNFTSDIGKILELQDVENGLDDYRSTAYLTFEQYRYYLFKEVFSALPDEMSVQDTLKVSEFIKY